MNTATHDKLMNDEVVLGLVVSLPCAGTIECMTRGWDWVWIDGQHGQHDYRSMLECVRVADGCGIAPIIRCPGHDPGTLGVAADTAPWGIMVPMVSNVEQALDVVAATRFPPLGQRSFGGRRAVDVGTREYYRHANQSMILIAQIETTEAIENAHDIAAVEGVDVIFYSPDDMRISLGLSVNTPISKSEQLLEAMEHVAKAARENGKAAGCIVPDMESFEKAVSFGYRLIAAGSDVLFLRTTSQTRIDELREALGG